MARKIAVEIVGDSSSVERSFKRASASATHFDKSITHAARGALAGSGAFEHLGRSLAFASGGFVAFAGVTDFLRDSIGAARDAQKAQASLAAQMKAMGESFAENKKRIEDATLSYGKFGFENDEVTKSLTVLERGTGSITRALSLQTTVANLARAKNIDLASAANVVAKVFGGQETALRRAVPGLEKSAHGMDLIREASARLAGQAAANTTAADKFAATLHDTKEIIGTALLPILDRYLNDLGGWLQKMNESGRLQRDVNAAVKTGTGIFQGIKAVVVPLADAFKTLGDAVGGTKNEVKLLLGVFLAFKGARLLSGLGLVTDSIVGIGTAARTSAGEVGALNTKVGLLARNPALTIAGLALADLYLGKKAFTQQATAGDVGGANKSPFVKGSQDDILFQAGLSGKTGTIQLHDALGGSVDLNNLNAEGRRAYAAGLKARLQAQATSISRGFSKAFETGMKASSSRTVSGLPGSVGGSSGGGFSVPSLVGGSGSGPSSFLNVPGVLGGKGNFSLAFSIPIQLQIAQAKAQALNDTAAMASVAKRLREVILKALHSGRLSLQAQLDAWNALDGLYKDAAATTKATARAVSSRTLTAGLGLNRDTRKALESRLALAGAFSGHVPTTTGVLGQSVNIGQVVLPNVDPYSVGDSLGKLGRAKPPQTRGISAGRSRALP